MGLTGDGDFEGTSLSPTSLHFAETLERKMYLSASSDSDDVTEVSVPLNLLRSASGFYRAAAGGDLHIRRKSRHLVSPSERPIEATRRKPEKQKDGNQIDRVSKNSHHVVFIKYSSSIFLNGAKVKSCNMQMRFSSPSKLERNQERNRENRETEKLRKKERARRELARIESFLATGTNALSSYIERTS